MRVKFLKDHGFNKKDSISEIPDGAANYLIRVKAAEEVKEVFAEKAQYKPAKEKKENKTGNVPTAKKVKK